MDREMTRASETLRANMRRLLHESGKSRSDLAKACGVSKAAVTGWLSDGDDGKGKTFARIDRIPAICDFFGVSINELFGIKKEFLEVTKADEVELVILYRALSDSGKNAVIAGLREYVNSIKHERG